ncbi:hypothetical protein PHLGIDRAFT_138835 [Phlebiopsis gigantea 11061_1 CR5-6]|uniref:Uncharacterized protein n=1 Tax=Phlebiopsis gigantea (strain 11061_1 CR5-6) TaxID=745531 RepID=A0A0C3SEN5_PHLG1|nr:hypothetical protein PHLGIDRAFT_138835 [Phlebiopsis gigantea 11061_1 CR5-6]
MNETVGCAIIALVLLPSDFSSRSTVLRGLVGSPVTGRVELYMYIYTGMVISSLVSSRRIHTASAVQYIDTNSSYLTSG